MRIPTVEIEVNGRKKIVNADDPRAQAPKVAAKKPARKPAAKKKTD